MALESSGGQWGNCLSSKRLANICCWTSVKNRTLLIIALKGKRMCGDLRTMISESLSELERRGDIVITSSLAGDVTNFLHERLRMILPNEELIVQELVGLRSLINHAIADERFFDWEMPTLTGIDREAFARIAVKLPKS
jgi:hypothetical protein